MANDEWITPPEVMEKVRKVFPKGISLDPASTETANKIIKAKRFFTEEQDALAQPWGYSTLWMNPPYSRGLVDKFVDKLILHQRLGDRQAIVLVNSATDTKWFHKLLQNSQATCFRKGRIRFWTLNLKPAEPNRPRYANVFFLFGHRVHRFCEVFSKEGEVMERYP